MGNPVNATPVAKLPLSFIPARELTAHSKADVMAEIIKFVAVEGPMTLGEIREYVFEIFDGNEPTLSPVVFDLVFQLTRTGIFTTDMDVSGDCTLIADNWNVAVNERLRRFIDGYDLEAEAAA